MGFKHPANVSRLRRRNELTERGLMVGQYQQDLLLQVIGLKQHQG